MSTHGTGTAPGTGVLLRILPTALYAGRARMLLLRSSLAYRRSWLAVVSGFFEPLFFLLALGQGLGSLVGEVPGPGGAPMSYTAFIASGLLAASAMNGAVYDSTFNVYFKLRESRLYDALLSTPLGPIDVAMGEIGWALLRGGMYATGFLVVMYGLGLTVSPWALLTLPTALLMAFAFAAVGMAATSFMRSWQDFDLVQLAIMPMFLFSGTFFPLDVYPAALQVVVQALPLYHGVELMRGLATGTPGLAMLGHVAYFLVMAFLGVVLAATRLKVLLLR